ncbi:MAG TPA: hypothetical protein VH044_12595 [Polyangiaceae bacterium]|nr:hypothetical protein [Polyangiaceae bacterium]
MSAPIATVRFFLPAFVSVLFACSGTAGDLGVGQVPDAGTVADATTGSGSSSGAPEASASGPDGNDQDVDPGQRDEAGSADDGGGPGMAGDDSGLEAGPSVCATLCAGCCDPQGNCHIGDSTNSCGAGGGACDNCAMHACQFPQSGCCKSSGKCGCSGILGCN